jgi:hypothetical protein
MILFPLFPRLSTQITIPQCALPITLHGFGAGLKSRIAKRYRERRPLLLDRKCVHRPLENCIIWARLHEELSAMLSAETSRQLFSPPHILYAGASRRISYDEKEIHKAPRKA